MQKLRQAFKDADDTFEMTGNDREMQVLAGASLAVLMHSDNDPDVAAAAALATTTTTFGGARKSNLPMDLALLAEGALDHSAEENRRRPTRSINTKVPQPKIDIEQAAAKMRELQSWDRVIEALRLAVDASSAAMTTLARRQANAMQTVDRFLRVQDEELQILWWLIGERSWTCNCAFGDVAPQAQPLIFAKELAGATQFLPGPPSIKAILSRAGLKEREKIAISAVINATERTRLKELLVQEDPSPVSGPVHFAIQRQLETGGGDAWIAGWAAAAEVDDAYALSPLAVGSQFYRESLLLLFG